MKTLDYYVSRPWTVRSHEHDDDGHYYSLTIDELPGFVVAAKTLDELDKLFWGALETHLRSYIEHGEAPPEPSRGQMLHTAEHPDTARNDLPQGFHAYVAGAERFAGVG